MDVKIRYYEYDPYIIKVALPLLHPLPTSSPLGHACVDGFQAEVGKNSVSTSGNTSVSSF